MSTQTTSTPLTGGVSCDVWIERDTNGREIVVKQALPRLKVVADWRSNPDRASVEVRALKVASDLLGEDIVPKVLWEDAANHRFAMERIDARLRNWKSELLGGRVELATAARVGELLGELHRRSQTKPQLATEFANREYFEQLRIEPFFIRVAQRNPSLAERISGAIHALRAPGEVLVHGDYSPKNLLVDGAEVVILDFEVAHWGNPRFDIAFCLGHLLLKGLRRGADAKLFAAAARQFLLSYRSLGVQSAFDAMLVRLTGCMLLARFEGASPVEYRDQLDAIHIKALATEMIAQPVADIDRAVESYFEKA